MPRKPRRNIPPQAPTGRPYGEGKALAQAQQAMPLAPPAAPTQVIPLDAPTMRPNEPVTAGLPLGPGPGPEVLGLTAPDDDVATQIRALYQVYPDDNIRHLLELYEAGF